jgi:hypothetical protein
MRKKAAQSRKSPPALADADDDADDKTTTKFDLVYLKSEKKMVMKFQAECKRSTRLFNQSEVIRAGIYALEELTPEQLKKVAESVPQL